MNKTTVVWGQWRDQGDKEVRVGVHQYQHPVDRKVFCQDIYTQTRTKEASDGQGSLS